MAYDKRLAERLQSLITKRKGFVQKEMFGGIGFLLNGNMCFGVYKDDLILRLEKGAAETALRDRDVRPFDITGKPMQGWVLVKPVGTKDAKALEKWLEQAIDFVKTLPAKSQKPKASKKSAHKQS